MEPKCASLALTPSWRKEHLFVVRATDAIRLCRGLGYQEVPAHLAGSYLSAIDRRTLADLRSFASRARLSHLSLAEVDDGELLEMLRSRIKSRDLVLVREGDADTGAQGSPIREQRRLVRAIEAATRQRLNYAGRQYKLVADADLGRVPDRNSYEVVGRDDAVQILAGLAKQGGTDTGALAKLLAQAQDQLSADWRPPFEPDGLILLRKNVAVHAPLGDTDSPITPSQMKKLLGKSDWIEIEVVYEDDEEPYTGSYRLDLPDASSMSGDFDSQGFLGKYDIEGGTCKLLLPSGSGPGVESSDADLPPAAEQTPGSGESSPTSPPEAAKVSAQSGVLTGVYTLVVFDENQTPLAGIPVQISTPAGTTVVLTDDGGSARVDNAPPGAGAAQIVALDSLRMVLAGHEQVPRRSTPLPEGSEWHCQPLGRADQPIALPDGQPQKLLLVTRADLYQVGQSGTWGDLAIASPGPWFLATTDSPQLQMHADGSGGSALVLGQAIDPGNFVPPDITPPADEQARWLPPDIYVVQSGDYLEKIAKRYLGDGARWPEIWQLNRQAYVGRSPNLIYPNEQFHMPPDGVPIWLTAQSAPAADPAPPPAPPQWASVPVDDLHGSLFDKNLQAIIDFLDGLPVDPPPDETPPSPPVVEALVFAGQVALAALQGNVDPLPADPDEETWPST